MPRTPLAGNAVTGTRDQARAPGTRAPAPLTPGHALNAPVAAASGLAPAIVTWRTRALPRWLAGLALLGVAASVAELAGLAATKGTDAGGYAGGAGPVLWVLWAAALAITTLAAKPHAAAPITGTRRK